MRSLGLKQRRLLTTAVALCWVLGRWTDTATAEESAAPAVDSAATPEADVAPVAAPAAPPTETLDEINIAAPEPRYVAPTRRDRIGRIWAPVMINGKGPFRLVLDTGASSSGIIAQVAVALGLPQDDKSRVMLRGVTGSAVVNTVRVDNVSIGDLWISDTKLPIVTDALGGAEGIIGTKGLADKRIVIDFRHDFISIRRSHGERAGFRFITVPLRHSPNNLLVVDAMIGSVATQAIIDTGGQISVANIALRDALERHRRRGENNIEMVTGVTGDTQEGIGHTTPLITMGKLQVSGAYVTFGDMRIFEHWKLGNEPSILIGMDVLGLLDTLIIDYRLHELQVLPRTDS